MLLESQRGETRGWLGSAGLNMSEFICWNIQIHHKHQFTIGKDPLRAGRSESYIYIYVFIYICIYICIFIYVFIYVFIHLVISSFIHVRSFYSLCAHSFLPLERGSAAPGRLPIYILNLKTFFLPELWNLKPFVKYVTSNASREFQPKPVHLSKIPPAWSILIPSPEELKWAEKTRISRRV